MDKKNVHNIPAGFPYNFIVGLSKAPAGSSTYTDITTPSGVPSSGWALCFLTPEGKVALSIPLNWASMDAQGHLLITLSAAQTLALSGKCLYPEVRNNETTSDLVACPKDFFVFVPNNLHNLQS